jgi:hypothetical protein
MFSECEEWLEAARDKLSSVKLPEVGTQSASALSDLDLQERLNTLQELKDSMEQGQHKLRFHIIIGFFHYQTSQLHLFFMACRYVLELKERVIMNTKEAGAATIVEETEGLKGDFDKLLVEMQEARKAINMRLGQLHERLKVSDSLNILGRYSKQIHDW